MGDALVLLLCLAIAGVIAMVYLNRQGGTATAPLPMAERLRAVHQALMVYGFDHGGLLPGMNPGGTLGANAPSQRLAMLTGGGYLSDRLLPRVEPGAAPVAMLDLSQPGDRRDAWRVDAPAHAYLLSEPPGDDPDAWSGWLIGNDGGGAIHADSPYVATGYKPDRPANPHDHLFLAQSADDAFLIDD